MITEWELLHPQMTLAHLGYLQNFLSTASPATAVEQIDRMYSHGGGWQPMSDWKMAGDTIQYPGDPPLSPIARTRLRDEEILLYPSSWVCVRQPDGAFEIARVD